MGDFKDRIPGMPEAVAGIQATKGLGVALCAAMIVLAALGAPRASSAAGPAPGGGDALVALARERGTVVIADFGLGLCRQCKAQAAILERVKEAYGGKVVVRMVPVNKEHDLAARYGVESIPYLVFLDAAGAVRLRRTGVMGFDDIAAQLRSMGVGP